MELARHLVGTAAMACSVAEVRRVIAAMGELHSARWHVRMESMQKFVALTRKTYEAYVNAAQEAARAGDEEPEVTEEVRAKVRSLFDSAWAILRTRRPSTWTRLPKGQV